MDAIQKFQELLKDIFQFNISALDFGIYKLFKHKREQLRKFIEKDLVNNVNSVIARYKNGNIDETKLQIFSDLYNFFSRYYKNGEFIPQHQCSINGHKYVIPYNGEEVKLYWANYDQYYVKTGLIFEDYSFEVDEYNIKFCIVFAKEEIGGKALKEKFFVLDNQKPVEINNKTLIVRFQYKDLSDKEIEIYQVKEGSSLAKQQKINQKVYEMVLSKVNNVVLQKALSKQNKGAKPLLLYHISKFTKKKTKDYFIHKDLNRFLSEQLDYFVKSEIISI